MQHTGQNARLGIDDHVGQYALSVARAIERERARQGVTRTALAEALGIGTAALRRRVRAQTEFSIAEVGDAAKLLDVRPERFLTEPEAFA